MPNQVHTVTDATFHAEALQTADSVMVEFWAPWCGACKNLAPVLEELAATYQGKMRFLKINVEENPATTATYEIRGLPTLIVFKNGEPAVAGRGVMTKAAIESMIDEAAAKTSA